MNYYFEERIVDTRQNELWTLKNFKLNNLVVGNYLVAKNNEEWASMGKYGISTCALYTIPIWLDNVNSILTIFAVSIFLYNDYFRYLSVEVNKAFVF